jgi:membrane protein YfhO
MSPSPQDRTRLSVVAAAFALPLLYFHRASFTDQIFIARDILRVYYPLKKYWAERVSQLQFPDWYPYDGLGQPFPGMLISGVFHPANLLYLLLPLGTALKLITLLSYVAALGGTYLFARLWRLERGPALLAGLTYALGGYMVGISNNLLYLMAASTFPWALWGAERFLREPSARRAATAALALCLVLLCGDPQSFALCNGMLLVLVLLRPDSASVPKAAPRAGLLIVLGALLCAVQLLSVLSTLRNGYPAAADIQVATRFAFHPLRLLELVLGPIFINPDTGAEVSSTLVSELLRSPLGSFWVPSEYMGLPALLLVGAALWSWRRHPLTWKVAGLTLVILCLTMARNLPLYEWFYRWVPLWKSFRYPEKLMPYVLFPGALGAGAGLQAVLHDDALARRLGQVGLGLAVVCGVFALGEWQWRWFSSGVIGALWEDPIASVQEMLHGNVLQGAVVAVGTLGATGLVLLLARQPMPRTAALVALQFAVLYLVNEQTYQVSYSEVLEQPTAMVDTVLRDSADEPGGIRPRVYGGVDIVSPRQVPEGLSYVDALTLNLAATLEPNTPGLWNLENASAYLPAASKRLANIMLLGHVRDAFVDRLGALYHTRYLTMDAKDFVESGGNRKVVLAEDSLVKAVLIRIPRTLPRAYLASPRCVADADTALELILVQDFRPGQDVALECEPGTPADAAPAGTGELGQVRIAHYAPESVELDVDARQPAVLVLNDAFYEGWSATVDGQPAPILPANVVVRGVRVPAGTHHVSFSYRTPGLVLGAIISLVTLGLLGLAVLVERRGRGSGAPAAGSPAA